MPISNPVNLAPVLDTLKADLLADIAAKHGATQTAVSDSATATQAEVNEIPLSPIKSVQRGVLSDSGSGSVYVVPIAEINPDKAFLALSGVRAGSVTYEGDYVARIKSATELEITIESSTGVVAWEVIEYV